MKRSLLQILGLTASAVGLSMLTACGGGDDPVQTEVITPPPVAASLPQTICGILPLVTDAPHSISLNANVSINIGGQAVTGTLMTSLSGYPYDMGVAPSLMTYLQDFRYALSGYEAQTTTGRMGVTLPGPRLDPGSVACVVPVSRVHDLGTPDTSDDVVSWTSEENYNLPIQDLPHRPLDGLEYINNFVNTVATAKFQVDKAVLLVPDEARICQVTASVVCSTPTVNDLGNQWEFSLPITQAGVYMLTAPE